MALRLLCMAEGFPRLGIREFPRLGTGIFEVQIGGCPRLGTGIW